jgi:hypothetical protein
MQINIYDKEKYNKYFIYHYLPMYMLEIIKSEYRSLKAIKLEKELKVNVLKVFTYAITNISITEQGDTYSIYVNKYLKYKKYNLNQLINFITYGNREIKGYNLLYILFNYIETNINVIYKE